MKSADPPTPLQSSRPSVALSLFIAIFFASASGLDPPSRASAPPACRGPQELAAVAGHSRVVRCAGSEAPARLAGPARRLFGLPIDANRADPATLEALPGIGPERAKAWLRTREERSFASARDLERIPGIGPKRAARLAPWVYFPAAGDRGGRGGR